MNNLYTYKDPLKIFISSAQKDEGDIVWSEKRRAIKEHLEKCPYLSAFIIEEGSSTLPSAQNFEAKIYYSDIVVMIVKSELRCGTEKEFSIIRKNNKPLLLYFICDNNINPEVQGLKQKIEKIDYCTYAELNDFDGIEKRIEQDVVSSLILNFRRIQIEKDNKKKETKELFYKNENTEDFFVSGVPDKASINLFSSCYDYIFELLDIHIGSNEEASVNSKLHSLGIAAIKWLITGENNFSNDDILKLIENAQNIYKNVDWLTKRWNAVKFALLNDFKNAYDEEKDAYNIANKKNLPEWIKNDILIDLRNIHSIFFTMDKQISENEEQTQINELTTNIYMPLLDRFLENSYEAVIKEEFRQDTLSKDTIMMTINIESALKDFENYFFTALLYGSYTHMVVARSSLIKILYRYAVILDNKNLFINVIRLSILNGNTDELENLIKVVWDKAYSVIVINADGLWELTDKVSEDRRDTIKIKVLSVIGCYLSDNKFFEAEKFLNAISSKVYWGNCCMFFECLYANLERIGHEKIVSMIIGIIEEKRFHIGTVLFKIIASINLKEVNYELKLRLKNALKENMPYMIEHYVSPQIIVPLEKQEPEIFSDLYSVTSQYLVGQEKLNYDINTNRGDICKTLSEEIGIAKDQYMENLQKGLRLVYNNRPYRAIYIISEQYFSRELCEILETKFFPLCIEVLSSEVNTFIKNECAESLCKVIVLYKDKNVILPNEFVEMFKISSKNFENSSESILADCKKMLDCRILLLKILLGYANTDEMIVWGFEFNKMDTNERIVLAKCVEQFLIHSNLSQKEIDAMVVSIVLQCVNDDAYYVRYIACRCLLELLNTKYSDLAENKLYEITTDPSHNVRSRLLELVKKYNFNNENIKKQIMSTLRNDANYLIRSYARN